MTTSPAQRPTPVDGREDAVARLERENAQLRQAVDSHAKVDQAIGVLVAVHRLEPAAGFEVLREVSQHTNVRLRSVAGMVIDWALGELLPPSVGRELEAALRRRIDAGDDLNQPG
ncbi:ANTAR domain-containing protein [Streptomyces massasporeus]|uniref:ANTAR domain-containing protein n=1 Tax=Streptomyces massasporeus TaxID=67324 RepID=UPI00371BAEA0